MFPQKYTHFSHFQYTPPKKQSTKTSNIIDLLNKRRHSEIKQHEKRNLYINTRNFLIENTKKVIHSKKSETKENNQQIREGQTLNTKQFKETFNHTRTDLASREARRAAAGSFRRKVWKSSDITPLVKEQQKKLSLYKNQEYSSSKYQDSTENQQKIRRYKDSTPIRIQQFEFNHKEKIKNEWLQGTYKISRKNLTQKNPEISQNTDHNFTHQMEQSYKNIIREDVKNTKMQHYYSLIRHELRPNTAGNIKRERADDNFIKPW